MQNFEIVFTNSPWLLLLLVPALGFTLWSYFRLAKRYRRTRNRITSIVLHMLVMLFSVATLSGMVFHYEVPNEKNEILLVVDVSDTEKTASETRDAFVEQVLSDGRYGNYKIGVVTFGFDQEYAVPMTYDVAKIYDAYTEAKLPDTSATDVASALEYARDIFKNPKTAKIVLVTDGKQTDRDAEAVIRTITAQGTRLDVANVPSAYEGCDAYVKSIEFPEYHVNKDVECPIVLNVESNELNTVDIALYDNGEKILTKEDVVLTVGEQDIDFRHTFKSNGVHEISFSIENGGDVLVENDTYTAYYYLAVFNKVLIVEREEGTSGNIKSMLGEDYDVTVKLASDASKEEGMPTTVDQLRAYDQVILNNIANADMPQGFDVILESYVKDYGGGLFTVGGKKEEDGNMIANAYMENDMYGSLYQEMLPVEAIKYTPPMGLVVIVDRSGSMQGTDKYGDTFLRWAKTTTLSCLSSLSERDYISVMTLDDNQNVLLPLTARTEDEVIREAIESIDIENASGGTVYPNAVYRAGQTLLETNLDLARKHIIMISDGATSEEEVKLCVQMLESFYQSEITFSFIGVNLSPVNYNSMKSMTDAGHGNLIDAEGSKLLTEIQKELIVNKVEAMNETKEFHPIIADNSSPLVKGLERHTNEDGKVEQDKLSSTLNGYHGVRARAKADVILKGEYGVPLYAQWTYGAGRVGCFMSDLQGTSTSWSEKFVSDETAKEFIRRVVDNLMPSQDISVKDVTYNLKEDNYTNQLGVFADLKNGQTVKASIAKADMDEVNHVVVWGTEISLNEKTAGDQRTLRDMPCYVTLALDVDNNYSRCDFVVKKSGVYKIKLQIVDKEGNPIVDENGEVLPNTVLEFYKSFAFSEEYLPSSKEDDALATELLVSIADRAQGAVIQDLEDPTEVFEGFVTALPESFDPRYLFMILALVCFLADIAVRKFKFKWPHEIIRDYKEKKRNAKKN